MSHQDFSFGPADAREGAQLPAGGLEAAPGRQFGRRAGEKQRVVWVCFAYFFSLQENPFPPVPFMSFPLCPALALLCL